MVAVDSIPTIQKRIVGTFKIIVIIILVMLIAVLATIQWKGDAIVANVIRKVETQLQDTLHYESIHLEWFSHFPSAALRIDGLTLGPENEPLIKEGHVDIVLRLFPLLREKIVINRILISESKVNIIQRDGRWSYEVFKKSEKPSENEWNALVDQIDLDRTILVYDDHEGMALSLDINTASVKGKLTGKLIDADIEMDGSVTHLDNGSYKLPSTISCDFSGNYKHDFTAETQGYHDWKIKLEGIDLEANGTTRKEKDQEIIDASITWKNGDAGLIKKLIPTKSIKDWNEYAFSGDTEGEIKISGKSSKGHTPQMTLSAVLDNGSIKIPGMDGKLSDVTLALNYDNGKGKSKGKSVVVAKLQKGSYQGHALKSDIKIDDLDHPFLTMDLNGSLPAGLLNLFSSSSGIQFHNGVFDIDHLKIAGLALNSVSIKTFIDKSETDFTVENLKFNYNEDVIEINAGKIHLDEAGKVNLDAEQFGWNKAKASDVKGVFSFISDKVDYSVTGSICQGHVESKGIISGLGSQRSVMDSDWKMKGVEIKEVMASFENFDQTFITSDNLKGKTNIWAHVMIPYDKAGNILSKDVIARAAVDIHDGELKGMKTLEDFSKYIHLEDLRHIRFNQFRNYLKVEGGKVYLPVVFIQSSAINMSVSGAHSFDQHILYHLKINAGQAVSNKVRKQDFIKRFKPARKSGWINFYYVLSGTASNVQYEQDQKKVLNGFEQSAAVKENLRSYLVDHFGYDVYWLEPNEWEDIPEYQ